MVILEVTGTVPVLAQLILDFYSHGYLSFKKAFFNHYHHSISQNGDLMKPELTHCLMILTVSNTFKCFVTAL